MTAPNGPVNVLIGFLSVFAGHLLVVALMFAIAFITSQASLQFDALFTIFFFAFFGIGITQLLYVIPLILWTKRKGRFDTMKGVIVGAVITLLLNGSCFLLLTTA